MKKKCIAIIAVIAIMCVLCLLSLFCACQKEGGDLPSESKQPNSGSSFDSQVLVIEGTRVVRLTEYGNTQQNIIIPYGVTEISRSAFWYCSNLTSIEIPSSVTSIGSGAFYGCSNLTGVYITDLASWCKIEFGDDRANPLSYAHNLYLNNELVTELKVPSSVTSIGNYAFYDCSSMTSIEVPSSVTSIGNDAFYGCSSLTNIEISSGVTSIGYSVFYGCKNITTATIPTIAISQIPKTNLKIVKINGGESIGGGAFLKCSSLESIEIPSSVKSIDNFAFHQCSSLKEVYITDLASWCAIEFGLDSNPLSYAHNLYLNNELVTELKIPSGVTSIGYSAFDGCRSLTSIEIPSEVTSVDSFAFYGCKNVTTATIPTIAISEMPKTNLKTVKINGGESIGDYAFRDFSSLTSIEIPSSVTSIGRGAFEGCSSLTIYCEASSKPSGWNSIWNNSERPVVVWGHNNITTDDEYNYVVHDNKVYITKYKSDAKEVVIPQTIDNKEVVSIGSTFNNNTYITSIEIPSGVTSIGDYAFYGCGSITSIEIPSSVTSIGSFAFYNCSSLTSIEIPSSVTSIGSGAFYGCSSLTIYCEAESQLSGWDSSWNSERPVVWGCVEHGETESGIKWGLTKGGIMTIAGYNGLSTQVLIPTTINGQSVTSIGKNAFRDCSSLISIKISSSVTSIGDYAFRDCSSLESIDISSSVTSIGNDAFEGCSSLTGVYITDLASWCAIEFEYYNANPLNYAHNLYLNNELVTELKIPSSVTSIGDWAFYGCSSITSIEISSSVTSIGWGAFEGCSSLTIYCEASSKPSGWNIYWNNSNCQVVWGYKG